MTNTTVHIAVLEHVSAVYIPRGSSVWKFTSSTEILPDAFLSPRICSCEGSESQQARMGEVCGDVGTTRVEGLGRGARFPTFTILAAVDLPWDTSGAVASWIIS
jgi:hypothetical protein